jgi:transposase
MNDALVHQIVVLFRGGASIRRIAQSLHISRRTVRRALDRVDAARGAGPAEGQSPGPPRRGSRLDAYEPAIHDLLARHPDITARRVHEELRPLGYRGSYTLLCQRVQAVRPRPIVPPVRRFETGPGLHYGKPGVMFSNAEGTGLPCPGSVRRYT